LELKKQKMRTKHPQWSNSRKEDPDYSFNRAVRYLSLRARSKKEIEEYLLKKNFEPKTISQTIKKLLELKFLNDEEFGKQWIESRQKYKGKSKYVLKNELQTKGLNKELIEKLLQTAEDDIETAKDFFERKKDKIKHLSKEDFEKKIIGMLQRKGFRWDVVKKVLQIKS